MSGSGGTMQAVRIHRWGQPPAVDEVPRPVPGEGETLVRVEAAAVAHLDLTVAGGSFGIKPELPYVGGVEGCGVVVDSDALEPGTRVVLRGGGLGLVRPGTWAEYVTVKTAALTPVVDGLGPALGATFWVPTTTAHTALHAVGRLGDWLDGVDAAAEHVVVAGAAGAVGSVAVQLARRAGATVTALVLDEEQAAALSDGVAAVVTTDADALKAFAADRPATLLVDTVGGTGLLERLRAVRAGGRAVLVGYVGGTEVSLELSNWLLDDVAMLPVNMIRRDRESRELAPRLAELLVSGELSLGVEEFELGEAGRAVELLRSGRLRGRGVLVPRA
ncbi:zinc-binding dehydrogenase [Nocardioides sp. YIM 152315]|uniref:quinone oxidoreductase family protein n=1 Tax=Nocardioides sp. YIM 152315 TaxID=3031760 RepID=UPI0023DA2256|nr:zinc-binding dehydrogenase [Nocardioides sp. YIM 152315]MDF1604495.1 zinc-binding dehydrogenase [Nocardioides sp. YIM 152315]